MGCGKNKFQELEDWDENVGVQNINDDLFARTQVVIYLRLF